MTTTIIVAIITGLGAVIAGWWARRQAAQTKAHSDSMDSQAAGELEAKKTEDALVTEKEKPSDPKKPFDPSNWQ